MDDLEFRRRVIAQWGISPDKYDGFLFGQVGWNTGSITPPLVKACMTPPIPVVVGHSLTFYPNWRHRAISGSSLSILWYKNDESYHSYNDQNSPSRTISVPSNAAYVRMPFDMNSISGAYIKDNTTGEYLWRGSDYV